MSVFFSKIHQQAYKLKLSKNVPVCCVRVRYEWQMMNVRLTKELHTIPEKVSTLELHLHDSHIKEEAKVSSYSRKKEKIESFRAPPYAA